MVQPGILFQLLAHSTYVLLAYGSQGNQQGGRFTAHHPHAIAQTPFVNPSVYTLNLQHDEEIKFDLDGVPFFSPTFPASFLIPDPSDPLFLAGAYTPVTVVSLPYGDHFTVQHLSALIRRYLEADDVLSEAWLSTIIIKADESYPLDTRTSVELSTSDEALLRDEFGVERFLFDGSVHCERTPGQLVHAVSTFSSSRSLTIGFTLRGPFLARQLLDGSIDLLPVYRLQSDVYRTFTVGIYPTFDGSYRELRMVDERGYNFIPVPSRLYSNCEEETGLCGARIGVKDLYDVRGVTTTAGSRVWGEFTGKASKSASSVQRFVDLGGILVGKTKTASFAAGAMGTEEVVDEQYPFSARGDLWQSCLGSSSGSACAMGAYDWLDIGLGSDTDGSVRAPAAVVGLYGNRASHGAIEMVGVVPEVDYEDTAGILVRDPDRFSAATKAWFAESPLNLRSYTRIPPRIILDTEFGSHGRRMERYSTFLKQLNDQLGIQTERADIEETLVASNWSWNRVRNELSNDIWEWFTWDRNGRPLYEYYAAFHDGRSPPTDPVIREMWRRVRDSNMTVDDYQTVVAKLPEFAAIINDKLLGEDENSCSKNIFLYDFGPGGRPLYREKSLNTHRSTINPFAVERKFHLMCPLAGCVDVTIPIGQVPYMSKISEHEEMAPVTVSLVARRGCDFMVAEFVERLAEVGIISAVKTGRTPF